jgi:hypothetical protein
MAKAKTRVSTPRRTASKIQTEALTEQATKREIEAKRAKAYADMEPHLCDVVRMGEIASLLFDTTDQGRFVFAVTHLEQMLQDLRRRYYASDFHL